MEKGFFEYKTPGSKVTVKVRWEGDAYAGMIQHACYAGCIRGAHRIRNEAIRLITRTPKTGRQYRVKSVIRQASAPGEAPANQTANLLRSITVQAPDRTVIASTELEKGGAKTIELGPAPDLERTTFRIVASGEYAAALEFGRLDGSIAARPYLRPALAAMREAAFQDIQRSVSRILGSGVLVQEE